MSTTHEPRPASFRPEVEGLRGVAVTLVVLDHLVSWPRGGFVGVDVFFVISGFLITTALLREFQTTGRIDFVGFYARRARRLLPAALFVIVVVVATASVVWFIPQSRQIWLDAVAALFSVTNWQLARNGVDYLAGADEFSPLRHFWSLAVEEQFYVVWPWLIVASGFVVKVVRRRTPSWFLPVALALGALSFAWSAWFTDHNPGMAYFDTVGRGWEFAVGAIAGVIGPRALRTRHRILAWLPLFGLGTIVASAVVIDPSWAFPAPWAIVPVVGTAMILLASDRASGPISLPLRVTGLTSSPVRFVGRISYSLYLWHWPVLVFTFVLLPRSAVATAIAASIMIGLAVGTHFWIEQPLRLRRRPAVAATRPTSRRKRSNYNAAIILPIVVAAASIVQITGPSSLRDTSAYDSPRARTGADVTFATAGELLHAAALPPASMPPLGEILPDPRAIDVSQVSPALSGPHACLNLQGVTATQSCSSGSDETPLTAALIGDSVALSWYSSIRAALPQSQWRIESLGIAACGPYSAVGADGVSAECARYKSDLIDFADGVDPDIVFVSSNPSDYVHFTGGEVGAAARATWQRAVEETIGHFVQRGVHVIVLTSPPEGPEITTCLTRASELRGCATTATPELTAKSDAERDAVASFGATDATFIDSGSWFCDEDGACPAVIGNYLTRVDRVHTTHAFGEAMGPALRAALETAGISLANNP